MDLGYILGAINPPANARNYVESYNRSVNLASMALTSAM
jgi:hypothetical protein